jgi:hypothetical protein
MERLWPRIRLVALLAAGSMLVHELRYVAGYGSSARQALAEQGHSYTSWLEALVCVLVAVAVVRYALSVLIARRGVVPATPTPRYGRLWAAASAALVAIYTVQEGLEGAFAPGHPSGLLGIYGHSGWTALFFSLLVGALIAAVMRVAHHTIEFVAARAAAPRQRRAPARLSRAVPETPPGRRLEVLAWHLAGRAPPRLH